MKIVGITGGIGSGKTIVCRIFNSLGIPVFEADKAAHQLYEKYPELTEKIRKEFSDEIIDKTGKINRKKLGEIVFNDENKLKKLNNIVHPFVKSDFDEWAGSHKGYPYIIKEAAILFESGTNEDCDKIITVVSPIELRISRIKERDHKSTADIENVINRQMSDEEKIKRSDYVLYNDEKMMLIPQVLKIHSALQ